MNAGGMERDNPVAGERPQLPLALYSAWLSMHKVSGRLLRRLGLTLPQFLVMQALAQHASMTVAQIGESLFHDSATLSPLLKRMERCGLLSRKRGVADERLLLVALTSSGFKLLADAEEAVEPIIHAAAATAQEQADLVLMLNTMRSTLLNLR
jgi:DNA-binding MarR family transcriptional regulator